MDQNRLTGRYINGQKLYFKNAQHHLASGKWRFLDQNKLHLKPVRMTIIKNDESYCVSLPSITETKCWDNQLTGVNQRSFGHLAFGPVVRPHMRLRKPVVEQSHSHYTWPRRRRKKKELASHSPFWGVTSSSSSA